MNSIPFKEFIEGLTVGFVPVVSSAFLKEEYVPIDLSETNPDLNRIDVTSSKAFETYIKSYLERKRARVAYGGYTEVRSIYRRSTHFNQQEAKTERNIHLGLDIWCDAGTEVLAPLGGKVHSCKNNGNYADYGPTIILEHTIEDITFYTLYGHLSLKSITDVQVGQLVEVGQTVATLGDATVNGDYAPHLHFQIIKDLEGNIGDYPGVSNRKDLAFYLQNCPDPNMLLKI